MEDLINDPFNIGLSASHFTQSASHTARPTATHRRKIVAAVVTWLSQNRQHYTYGYLKEHVITKAIINTTNEINISASSLDDTQMAHDLQVNEKITYLEKDKTYTYKPTIPGLATAADIEKYMADRWNTSNVIGVLEDDFLDAYKGVEADLAALLARKVLIKINNPEAKKNVFFYRDRTLDIRVDADIRKIWADVEVPANSVDLDAALISSRHLSAEAAASGHLDAARRTAITRKRLKDAQVNKRKNQRRRNQNITNVHLMGTAEFAFLGDLVGAGGTGAVAPIGPPKTTTNMDTGT